MINIVSGFDITANVPVDSRIIKTKAEMKATQTHTLPEVYFCICKEDGNLYLYDSNIETDKENPDTGKYVKVSGRPTVYHFTPEEGKTEEEIEDEIEELVKTLNPGDAIVYREGDESVTYVEYPNGKWDSTSDEPLFASDGEGMYRYDIFINSETGENESCKGPMFGSTRIKLSPEEADKWFKEKGSLKGYAAAAPTGKVGYLIPSSKTVYLEDIKSGYTSIEQIIAACVPTASNKSTLKQWTLMMNAE